MDTIIEVEVERGEDHIFQVIGQLNTNANLLDWKKYLLVYERAAEFLCRGCFPDYIELEAACKMSIEDVKDAFRSVFILDYTEKERKLINKFFFHVFLHERVRVKQDWLAAFASLVSNKSHGQLRLEITPGQKMDMVLRYKKEAHFKVSNPQHKSTTYICLCPEWKKPFFSVNQVLSFPQSSSQRQTPSPNKNKQAEEEEKEDGGKGGWRCVMM